MCLTAGADAHSVLLLSSCLPTALNGSGVIGSHLKIRHCSGNSDGTAIGNGSPNRRAYGTYLLFYFQMRKYIELIVFQNCNKIV